MAQDVTVHAARRLNRFRPTVTPSLTPENGPNGREVPVQTVSLVQAGSRCHDTMRQSVMGVHVTSRHPLYVRDQYRDTASSAQSISPGSNQTATQDLFARG